MVLQDLRNTNINLSLNLKENESAWLIIHKQDFQKVYKQIKDLGYYCNLENWIRFSVLPDFKRIDVLHVTKTKDAPFHSIKYKRPCVTPYVNKDGSPRGWEYDENGDKVRYTGLGNVFFLSSEDSLISLLRQMTE